MPILLKPTAATSQLSAIDPWITLDIMRGLSKTRAAMLIFFGCPLVLILGLNLLFQDDLISLNKMVLHDQSLWGQMPSNDLKDPLLRLRTATNGQRCFSGLDLFLPYIYIYFGCSLYIYILWDLKWAKKIQMPRPSMFNMHHTLHHPL